MRTAENPADARTRTIPVKPEPAMAVGGKYDIEVPKLDGRAVLWGHCHGRATGAVSPEKKVLERMGMEVRSVSGGCCGLAGSWGFEKGKYDLSMDCGEQAVLPAVREAPASTVVVADGFSCKTQIAEAGTGRRALHLGEVMALARDGGIGGATPAETALGDRRPRPGAGVGVRLLRTAGPLAGIGAAAAAGLVARRAGSS